MLGGEQEVQSHVSQEKSIQHDLTKNQINELKHIKAQAIEVERNNPSDSHKYRVRGPPGFWKIVKLPKN